MRIVAIIALCFSILCAKGQTNVEISTLLEQVSKDSIARTIQDLENFDSRYCNKLNGNIDVAQYLQQRYQNYGYDAWIDTFHVQKSHGFDHDIDRDMYNVRVRVDAMSAISDTTIILGAHLDAIALQNYTLCAAAPGADDNASGCAMALEVARILAKNNLHPRHNIEFLAWDGEEIGLCGANADCSRRALVDANEYVFVLNNDMVAHQPEDEPYRLKFYRYDNSFPMAEQAVQICEDYTTIIPTSPPDDNDVMRNYSDSKSYIDWGHHAVFTIEHYFTDYYHTEQDLLANCNMDYAAEVAKYNLAAICIFARVTSPSTSSITENDKLGLKVYPNPAADVIYIELKGIDISESKVLIYDNFGREVLAQPGTQTLDIQHLPAGFYMLKVQGDDQQVMEKILINN